MKFFAIGVLLAGVSNLAEAWQRKFTSSKHYNQPLGALV